MRLIIIMAVVATLSMACNKVHYINAPDISLEFVDSMVSYVLGDTLEINVRAINNEDKQAILPYRYSLIGLTFKTEIDSGYIGFDNVFTNYSFLEDDSRAIYIKLDPKSHEIFTAQLLPAPDFKPASGKQYKLELYYRIDLEITPGTVSEYSLESSNMIRIDIK